MQDPLYPIHQGTEENVTNSENSSQGLGNISKLSFSSLGYNFSKCKTEAN
jgi:hypothetical protein